MTGLNHPENSIVFVCLFFFKEIHNIELDTESVSCQAREAGSSLLILLFQFFFCFFLFFFLVFT